MQHSATYNGINRHTATSRCVKHCVKKEEGK
nr:MAG TPA: hypothetical protein [Caudoviricetes sp.]